MKFISRRKEIEMWLGYPYKLGIQIITRGVDIELSCWVIESGTETGNTKLRRSEETLFDPI